MLTLEKLIELKLASGMTASDRLRDLADVQELVKIKRLPPLTLSGLASYVRAKYLELWNGVAAAAHREDEDQSER